MFAAAVYFTTNDSSCGLTHCDGTATKQKQKGKNNKSSVKGGRASKSGARELDLND